MDSDEDIDDEIYLKRHEILEKEEIKRYNVGLKVKSNNNSKNKKKQLKEIEEVSLPE